MIPSALHEARLAILGLGLMGGSLALALRSSCAHLTVYDPDPEIRTLAKNMGIAKRVDGSVQQALEDANYIILAAPVGGILELIQSLPNHVPDGAFILDIGSTKVEICRVLRSLPPRFLPIGGHPMTGKSVAGLINADAEIFVDSVFALSVLENTSEAGIKLATELVHAIRAQPFFIDPDLHDRFVAATSHVPYLLSLALALATPDEAQSLVGPGFRSTARLAGSPVTMMRDVLLTNRDNIVQSLQLLIMELENLKQTLVNDDINRLVFLMKHGQKRYLELIDGNRIDGVS